MSSGQHPPNNNYQPLYRPGQFQPSGYNPPPPPPYPQPQPHDYGGWTLAFLLIGYLAALIMAVVDVSVMDGASNTAANSATTSSNSTFGMVTILGAVLLIVLHVIVMIKDGRSFFTLFEKI